MGNGYRSLMENILPTEISLDICWSCHHAIGGGITKHTCELSNNFCDGKDYLSEGYFAYQKRIVEEILYAWNSIFNPLEIEMEFDDIPF